MIKLGRQKPIFYLCVRK